MSKKTNTGKFRIAALDIEATALRTTYGRLLCCGIKFFDESTVHCPAARNWDDEPALLEEISRLYAKMDVVVTYNGKMYDIPFLNGRLMQWKMPPIPLIKHVDLLWHAKKMRLVSARLMHVEALLDLPSSKFNVAPSHWIRAANGNAASLAKIVKHCKEDVKMTEELFHRLAPFVTNITR